MTTLPIHVTSERGLRVRSFNFAVQCADLTAVGFEVPYQKRDNGNYATNTYLVSRQVVAATKAECKAACCKDPVMTVSLAAREANATVASSGPGANEFSFEGLSAVGTFRGCPEQPMFRNLNDSGYTLPFHKIGDE